MTYQTVFFEDDFNRADTGTAGSLGDWNRTNEGGGTIEIKDDEIKMIKTGAGYVGITDNASYTATGSSFYFRFTFNSGSGNSLAAGSNTNGPITYIGLHPSVDRLTYETKDGVSFIEDVSITTGVDIKVEIEMNDTSKSIVRIRYDATGSWENWTAIGEDYRDNTASLSIVDFFVNTSAGNGNYFFDNLSVDDGIELSSTDETKNVLKLQNKMGILPGIKIPLGL